MNAPWPDRLCMQNFRSLLALWEEFHLTAEEEKEISRVIGSPFIQIIRVNIPYHAENDKSLVRIFYNEEKGFNSLVY